MSKFYTEEMKKYIAENCKGKTIAEFQSEFNNKFNTNVTYTAMKSYLSGHKLKVGRGNNKKYKKEHVEFIRNNVKGITLKELTNKFNKEFNMNVSESAIANIKNKYNLQSGIVGGQFQKGQKSWNKGRKMSPSQYEKSKPTMFKKGNIPANARAIGSERIDKNGYILIKTQDGNNRNFDLNNLIVVSDAEELIMNQNKLFKQDTELTKTGVIIAKVLDKANKRKK